MSETSLKQARNKNAIEPTILNRVLDRDRALNCGGPLSLLVSPLGGATFQKIVGLGGGSSHSERQTRGVDQEWFSMFCLLVFMILMVSSKDWNSAVLLKRGCSKNNHSI